MSNEYGAEYAGQQLARRNSPVRRFVKEAYLRSALREIDGPTVDFGCGAGQLLERLPAGSTGLEVNSVLVADMLARGLDARLYDALEDEFRLSCLVPGRYTTFVASHVLEHFEDAANVLKRLASACERLGIRRLIVIVPGWRGFLHDPTHRTFVDGAYVATHRLDTLVGFRLLRRRAFPVRYEPFGRLFTYNETVFVWAR